MCVSLVTSMLLDPIYSGTLKNERKSEAVTELRFKYVLHCKIKQEAKLEKKEGSVNSQTTVVK